MLSPVEMQMAMTKMRARRTPSNQAHVTNQLDDPLLIAADAASAVAYGFREVETTVPVLGDAPSNAVALLIGSQVGMPGAMAQCSIEEALELRLGLRGLTSYAETISLYGTEQVFVDGDDTPFSQGDPHLRLRLARPQDAGDQRRWRRGADGRGREVLDPVPGVALRLAGAGRWDPRACRTAASTASAWWPRCPTA